MPLRSAWALGRSRTSGTLRLAGLLCEKGFDVERLSRSALQSFDDRSAQGLELGLAFFKEPQARANDFAGISVATCSDLLSAESLEVLTERNACVSGHLRHCSQRQLTSQHLRAMMICVRILRSLHASRSKAQRALPVRPREENGRLK